MMEFKLSSDMVAVPLECDECGKHKPIYIVLIKYKTEKDSDDYYDGMTEVEVSYDSGHYCRQCINKLFKQEVTTMNKNDKMWKCPICDRLISNLEYMTNDGSNICPRCLTSIVYYKLFMIDKDDTIPKLIDMESIIKDAINEVLDEELEKSYRAGYSRGYEEGVDEGYSEGYNDGYNIGVFGL